MTFSFRVRSISVFMLFLIGICTNSCFALGEPELALNFNKYPDYSNVEIVSFNNQAYLSYETKETGKELFVISQPGDAPKLVKDIYPGTMSSEPMSFAVMGGNLYFFATTQNEGRELWRTDGTSAGTTLVGEIVSGDTDADPGRLKSFASSTRLVFNAVIGSVRVACTSDGTDIVCSDVSVTQNERFDGELNGNIYFSGNDGTLGRELWKLTGATRKFTLVKDLNTTTPLASSDPFRFVPIPDKGVVVFTADDGIAGEEPWITNGSSGGTFRLDDINPGSASSNAREYVFLPSGALIFKAESATTGMELYSSSLSLNDVTLVRDIVPGSIGSDPRGLVLYNSKIYFSATTPAHGEELWATDGTFGGTTLVKDINPGAADAFPYFLTAHGGKLYFVGYNLESGEDLWVSDGTNPGTQPLDEIFPGAASSYPSDFISVNGRLVFFAFEQNAPSVVYLNSNGTGVETFSPIPAYGDESGRGFARPFFPLTDTTGLTTFDVFGSGEEPYLYNYVTDTPTALKDIHPGENGSYPSFITKLADGRVLFRAEEPEHGSELWVTDGTAAGTTLFSDLIPGSESSNVSGIGSPAFTYNGYTILSGRHGDYKATLWKTDGTPGGTTLIKGFGIGSTSNYTITSAIEYKGLFYFYCSENGSGIELCRSDGTSAGSGLFADLAPGSDSSFPLHFLVHDNILFFQADGPSGRELYKTDGTASGTGIAIDIWPGIFDSSPVTLTSYKGALYFIARVPTPVNAYALYKLSAPYEEADLEVVKIFDPTTSTNTAAIRGIVNDLLYISAHSPGLGRELWTSDGTETGTTLLKDLNPGAGGGEPSEFTRAGDYHYFRAYTDDEGYELWRTDGTSAGTVMVKDIWPGVENSFPTGFDVQYGTLYFDATTEFEGNELWKLVFDECPFDDEKIEPGQCGCGAADTDADNDGILDCSDSCPADALKAESGSCGCGIADTDLDASGVADCLITEEIQVRITKLKTLLGDFKSRKKKGRKKAVKEIFEAFKDLNIYTTNQIDAFVNSTPKKTKKRLKLLGRKIKVLRKKPAKAANKKKALKALARLLAIAP